MSDDDAHVRQFVGRHALAVRHSGGPGVMRPAAPFPDIGRSKALLVLVPVLVRAVVVVIQREVLQGVVEFTGRQAYGVWACRIA